MRRLVIGGTLGVFFLSVVLVACGGSSTGSSDAEARRFQDMWEIDQIEKMEMRDWHIKKLWNYYIRKANVENVLPQSWADQLVPTKEMLKRDRML